jgi:hypothetical protein
MKNIAIILLGLLTVMAPAHAQYQLSIVEGAACAQSAAHIEAIEKYNNSVHDEIGDRQASSDPSIRRTANALIVHFERMVEFRKKLIAQYELVCAQGTMSLTDMRKICRPQTSGISFMETVFCKPLRELE